MKFTSLNEAFENAFIKSLPHLTKLDLTANEKLIIELVLSFKRIGKTFYMNHNSVAEYLVLGDTKNKAKIVGNIIRGLKKKGFINTFQTHNFKGKKGGSSLTIEVNETYLEQMLLAVFNTEPPVNQETISNTCTTPIVKQNQEFIDELAQLDSQEIAYSSAELEPINLEFISENTIAKSELLEIDFSQMDEVGFKSHLQKIIRLEGFKGWKESIQLLIDNDKIWELQFRKGGLSHIISQVA